MKQWNTELWLFTPEEFHKLPDGIELVSINGNKAIKGKDYIDQDTRFGYLAYGVMFPWDHELKDTFLIFSLSN